MSLSFWLYLLYLLTIICFCLYRFSTHGRRAAWLRLQYRLTKPLLIWDLKVPFLFWSTCLCFYINILINNNTMFVMFMCFCQVSIGMDNTFNTIWNIVKNFAGSIQLCMCLKSSQVLWHEGMSLCVYVGDLWWGH